jgi:hypothetical protein
MGEAISRRGQKEIASLFIPVFSVFVIASLACVAPVHAEIYKWIDQNGIVHYSSQPGDESAQAVEDADLPPITSTGVTSSETIPGTILIPENTSMTIHVLFDDKPLSSFTSVTPVFRLFNLDFKQWVVPDVTYNANTSTFLIRDIIDANYNAQVTVDADQSNPERYPGDYQGSIYANLASKAEHTMEVTRIIHITGPEDNSQLITDWSICSNMFEVETPAVIAWESLGKDVTYSYSIDRTACPFVLKQTVAADKTSASKIVLDLPPNKKGEYYTLKIEARKNNKAIGSLVVHRKDGWNWDYRFRVIPKRGPTRVISPREN